MNTEQIIISKANAEDADVLRRLWIAAFQDSPELIDAFFHYFPPSETAWVVRKGVEICSAAYAIPGNQFLENGKVTTAVYVYAVATFPEHRRNGYAGMLMRAVSNAAMQAGMILYTRPAFPKLFAWYQRVMQADHVGYMTEKTIAASDLSDFPNVLRITPKAYGARRERILEQVPHIKHSDAFLSLQELYCCGFFAVGKAIACCADLDGVLTITELLCDTTDSSGVIQALLHHFGADQAVLRFPCRDKNTPLIAYCGKTLPMNANWGLLLE